MSGLVFIYPRLCKMIPLLGSDRDGEVIAAARAIDRTLREARLDFHSLAEAIERGGKAEASAPMVPRTAPSRRQPPFYAEVDREWGSLIAVCVRHRAALKSDQRAFVEAMHRKIGSGRAPTPKQGEWLKAIANRLRANGAS